MNYALLLAAIIAVESGGDPNAVGDNGRAVGILQIRKVLVVDYNERTESMLRWPDAARDPATARHLGMWYLHYWGARYTERTGQPLTYEVAARIWNGGPRGYAIGATERYWHKVRPLLPAESIEGVRRE